MKKILKFIIYLTLTGTFSIYCEYIFYVCFAFFQSTSRDFNFFRITHFPFANGYFEWRVDDLLSHSFHRNYVLADLSRGEGYTWNIKYFK